MVEPKTSSLLGLNREELVALVGEAGQPSYRAKQIMDAVYRQRVEDSAEISTLPSEFREWLEQNRVTVGAARIENKFVSQDGTVRYLVGFADGQSTTGCWPSPTARAWRRCGCPRAMVGKRGMGVRRARKPKPQAALPQGLKPSPKRASVSQR